MSVGTGHIFMESCGVSSDTKEIFNLSKSLIQFCCIRRDLSIDLDISIFYFLANIYLKVILLSLD